MRSTPSNGRNPALIQGLTMGVALGIILVILNLVGMVGALGGLFLIISVIAALAAYFYSGMRTSQITETIGSGALAGLLTAFIGSLFYAAYFLILVFVNMDTLLSNAQKAARQAGGSTVQITSGVIIGGAIFYLILILILSILAGLALGAIGGAVGRGRAPLPAAEEYRESLFQSPPAQGQSYQSYQPFQQPTPEGQPSPPPPPDLVPPDEPPAILPDHQ